MHTLTLLVEEQSARGSVWQWCPALSAVAGAVRAVSRRSVTARPGCQVTRAGAPNPPPPPLPPTSHPGAVNGEWHTACEAGCYLSYAPRCDLGRDLHAAVSRSIAANGALVTAARALWPRRAACARVTSGPSYNTGSRPNQIHTSLVTAACPSQAARAGAGGGVGMGRE